jgi:hypothetical protein
MQINCFKNLFWEGDGKGRIPGGEERNGENDEKEDFFLFHIFPLFARFHRRMRSEKIQILIGVINGR